VSLLEQRLSRGIFLEDGYSNINTRIPGFEADSKFDSDSVLEVCMGGDNYQIECKIKDLTLLYNTYQEVENFLYPIHRKIITNSKEK